MSADLAGGKDLSNCAGRGVSVQSLNEPQPFDGDAGWSDMARIREPKASQTVPNLSCDAFDTKASLVSESSRNLASVSTVPEGSSGTTTAPRYMIPR